MLTKSKAKETLQLNFSTLERAAMKLEDEYLLESFTDKQLPVTYKVAEYLDSLEKETDELSNTCVTCGIKYFYTPMCSTTECRHCNNLDQFKDRMIVEPENLEQLLSNLEVLSSMFDHEVTKYNYKDEIQHWLNYSEYEKRPKDDLPGSV